MTTVVIKDGVIYSDIKATALVAVDKSEEMKRLEKEIIKSIPGASRIGRILRQSQFFNRKIGNFDLSSGKFFEANNLIFSGLKVKAVAFAGNAAVAGIMEYVDRTNMCTKEVLSELRSSRRIFAEMLTKMGVPAEQAAAMTFSCVAMVTESHTFVAVPMSINDIDSEWTYRTFSKHEVVSFGSGRDMMVYGDLETVIDVYAKYDKVSTMISDLVVTDLKGLTPEEFIVEASKVDAMTGDVVFVHDTSMSDSDIAYSAII